jgi:hypothetical protein
MIVEIIKKPMQYSIEIIIKGSLRSALLLNISQMLPDFISKYKAAVTKILVYKVVNTKSFYERLFFLLFY